MVCCASSSHEHDADTANLQDNEGPRLFELRVNAAYWVLDQVELVRYVQKCQQMRPNVAGLTVTHQDCLAAL